MALVAFDFDGTLSTDEMTVLLGEQCGVADEMRAITKQAMNDELDYAESLRRRVSLLDGLDGEAVQAAFEQISFRPGAVELLTDLSRAGVKTAILTGGFVRGVRHALDAADASVDFIVANELGVAEKQLTGDVSGPLVEGTKDVVLRAISTDLDVTLADTIAIGDGANDLPMLRAAGTSIGFKPKPAVRDACDTTVTSMDELRSVFVEQGILTQ